MNEIIKALETYVDMAKIYLHMVIVMVCWIIMAAAPLIDMWDGVQTSRMLKEPILSNRLRKTVAKINEYWRFMLVGFFIDALGIFISWYSVPCASMIFTLAILCVELKSMREHAQRRNNDTSEMVRTAGRIMDCKTIEDGVKLVKEIKGIK